MLYNYLKNSDLADPHLGRTTSLVDTDAELFDASRRLADLVTMEAGITPLLARLFAAAIPALTPALEDLSPTFSKQPGLS